jgi:hypothetical protein
MVNFMKKSDYYISPGKQLHLIQIAKLLWELWISNQDEQNPKIKTAKY